jgi:uncharacterized protein YqjF (DUF2071 family)
MADSNGPRQYGDERDRLQDSPITEADRRAVRGTITHMDGVDDLATSMINSRRLRADHHVRHEVNSSATHRAARDTIPHSTTGMMRGLRSSSMSRGPVAEVICRDVLFAHWPIAVDGLRPAVPSELTIETFDGTAWIGIVVVDIAEARVQRVPYRPSLSLINLRTYVAFDGEPGVYFISLEMDGQLGTWVARNGFGLPYHHATIESSRHDGVVRVSSRRDRRSRSGSSARFEATYRPDIDADPSEADPDSVEAFLIERTDYFVAAGPDLQRTATLLRTIDSEPSTPDSSSEPSMFVGAARHDPWPLLPVEATIDRNTLSEAAGLPTPDTAPIYHYSRQQHMTAERIQHVSSPSSGSP